jgi:hypothetical protein
MLVTSTCVVGFALRSGKAQNEPRGEEDEISAASSHDRVLNAERDACVASCTSLRSHLRRKRASCGLSLSRREVSFIGSRVAPPSDRCSCC